MAASQDTKSTDPYFNSINPDLLNLIPLDAKVVLEIGCGAGRLAEAYRRRNPSVTWLGIEKNQEVSREAERHGVKIIGYDVVGRTISENTIDESCDCLVFADVLEHIENPWDVVKSLAANVVPGGQILASIPNVQHWSIISNLMAGRFEYTDSGLMDRTHLRWFTAESIKKMFEDAGLHVYGMHGRLLGNERLEEWMKLSGLIEAPKEWRVYQWIARAIKPISRVRCDYGPDNSVTYTPIDPEPIQPLHIHAIYHRCTENGTVCERPRIDEPLAALATIPGVKTSAHDAKDLGSGSAPDILIFQRFMCPDKEAFLKHYPVVLSRKCVTIAEFDDDPEIFPAQQASNFMALRAVHAVQVSTERLANVVRKYNPNVAVFENQMMEIPDWAIHADSTIVGIFYGALNRQRDWEPIMPAINRVTADNPDIGFCVVADRAFYDALECNLKVFHEFLPYDQYISELRKCHIAILPLEPSQFNECKSDIKFLECAANGVCVLASETVYGKTIDHDLCGATYDVPSGFENRLRELIKNPYWRNHYARDAYAYVRDYRMLGQHYRKRFRWYMGLIEHRERLHRELLERVPELKGAE